mmetsp:Transcript_124849/g.249310  ORF Transcript_124849/g.249310 Transcript_124849/m.249310 type:complete len:213 (-) Transcript_124849:136-774(-)
MSVRTGSAMSESAGSGAVSERNSIDQRSESNYGGVRSRRNSNVSSIAEREDDHNVPMDPVLKIFYSTNEMIERLDNMEVSGRWHRGQGPRDHVTLADIEGGLDELMEEKDPDLIGVEAKKMYEAIARKTIIEKGSKDGRKLNAARMCEIENRLQTDPSLQLDPNDCIPENQCAPMVKRSLIRTYQKIKKMDHNLSQHTTSLLEDRISILRGP